MDWIKKHWMKVVTVIFVLLFCSMCSNNCSNKNRIRTLQKTYASSDSIISNLNDSISCYKLEIKDLKRDVRELESKNRLLEKNVSDLNAALKRSVIVNIKNEDKDERQ